MKQVTQDDIIYFVVTDRFFGRNKRTVDPSDTSIHGGTLDGILEKLDYLIELGVTTIWVTPVYENIESHGQLGTLPLLLAAQLRADRQAPARRHPFAQLDGHEHVRKIR